MRNLSDVQIKAKTTFEKVCPFPVGFIYQSSSSTSPASIYGGTWSPLSDGKFLRPKGAWNQTGGEDTHTLTIAEMPSHNHQLDAIYMANFAGSAEASHSTGWEKHSPNVFATTVKVGGNTAHNNVPAYRTCYCWYRTA